MAIRTPKSIRYDLHIKELDKTISYRALKVGEQKTLLTTISMKDPKALVNCIIDIVAACTFNELDMSKLPMHLVDYIFLKVYIKSSGNMSQAEFQCPGMIEQVVEGDDSDGEVETVPCASTHRLNIDLNRADLRYAEDYEPTKVIDVGDDIVIKLRLPSFEAFRKIEADGDWMDMTDQFIFSGIECIQDGDDLRVPGVDFELDDLVDWINELDSNVLRQINDFFQTAPSLVLHVPVTCPNCGRKEDFELTHLEDFFG